MAAGSIAGYRVCISRSCRRQNIRATDGKRSTTVSHGDIESLSSD